MEAACHRLQHPVAYQVNLFSLLASLEDCEVSAHLPSFVIESSFWAHWMAAFELALLWQASLDASEHDQVHNDVF